MDSFDMTSEIFQGPMTTAIMQTKYVDDLDESLILEDTVEISKLDRIPDGEESPTKDMECSLVEDVINAAVTEFFMLGRLGPRPPCDGQESLPHSTYNNLETPTPSRTKTAVEKQHKQKLSSPRCSESTETKSRKFYKTILRRIKTFRKESKTRCYTKTLAVL